MSLEKISGCRVVELRLRPDGLCDMVIEVQGTQEFKKQDGIWRRLEASKLTLDDRFLKEHTPVKGTLEVEIHNTLELLIKKGGIKDFWRPIYDPSLTEDNKIIYKSGSKPAIGKSYNWWVENVQKVDPKRKSRLGTKTEYILWLGILIKTLVQNNWTVEEAWSAVCQDSSKLGHYRNSKGAKRNFEPFS